MAYTEHIQPTPKGWKVRTLETPTGHRVVLAFPKGPRKRGSGRLVEIVHPHASNPKCRRPKTANPDTKGFKAWLKSIGKAVQAPSAKKTNRRRGCTKAANRKRPVRKNLDEIVQAQQLRSEFVGKPSTKITKLHEPFDQVRDDFALLGPFLEAAILPESEQATIDGEDLSDYLREKFLDHEPSREPDWNQVSRAFGVKIVVLNLRQQKVQLCASADGAQLYAIGGNQDMSATLEEFEVDPTKDLIVLGSFLCVAYAAEKAADKFVPSDYYHCFAEEGGVQPLAQYDRLQKRIKFAGGTYTIKRPGILN
jgi:hypothetical protein